MKVQKIDHVAILVKDIDKAAKFYGNLFGTEFSGPRENKELDIKNLMSPIGIELVTPLTPNGVLSRTLANRGEGMTLLSLAVPDIKRAVADMKAAGVRQIGGGGSNTATMALFHPKDLFGVTIELIERKD
jgi:methylmalonyl-CoA epimerase